MGTCELVEGSCLGEFEFTVVIGGLSSRVLAPSGIADALANR